MSGIEENSLMKKIRITTVSRASIAMTVVVGAICVGLFVNGRIELNALNAATQSYMDCDQATRELQDGSNYLKEQARLAATTGDVKYANRYFQEANVVKRREHGLATLKKGFDHTDAYKNMTSALEQSRELMKTEEYAMRLALEGSGTAVADMPEEVQEVELSAEDAAATTEEKSARAQDMMTDGTYEGTISLISTNLESCSNALVKQTKDTQQAAMDRFYLLYHSLEVAVGIFALMALFTAFVMRKLVVKPLITYNESITRGEIFPVIGAKELQTLAETYNTVYRENEQIQALIRHQAEHDPLTDLLNRGSYDKMLDLYEKGADEHPFALIMIDVDTFKQVNDTYGHATGDAILKHVAHLITIAWRNIDHVCRIGGDEFAIIMVEMTSDLAYTIEEKVDYVNDRLAHPDPETGLPPVSISVGVAFTDRADAGETLFKDADAALYNTKENGRAGYTIHGAEGRGERHGSLERDN